MIDLSALRGACVAIWALDTQQVYVALEIVIQQYDYSHYTLMVQSDIKY
jgi:hypothetical protein